MSRICLVLIVCGVAAGMFGAARADMPSDPDLVIYYTFDDIGRIVADQSGKGHDGAVHGDVASSSEKGHRAGQSHLN